MKLKRHKMLSTRRGLVHVRCGGNALYRIERMDELLALSRDLSVQTEAALDHLNRLQLLLFHVMLVVRVDLAMSVCPYER